MDPMQWLSKLFSRRFVRDLATLQIGQLIAMGCNFLSSILYARLLGLEGYGEYAVVLTLTGVMGLLTNLGQKQTTLTFFAEAYGRQDRHSMRTVLQYYFLCGLGTAALLLIGIGVLPTISVWVYGSPTIGLLARFVFLASLFDIIYQLYVTLLQATREIKTVTVVETSAIIVQLAATTVFLLLGFGVEGVLLGSLSSSALFAVFSLFAYPRLASALGLPQWGDLIGKTDWSAVRKYVKDGAWIAIDKSAGNLYPNLFLFILSAVAPVTVIGLIRLALKLASLPASFVLSTISRLSSSVIPLLASQGPEVLRRNVTKLVRHTVLVHIGTTFAAIVCVWLFLPIVYGPDFMPAIYPFIVITLLQILLATHTFTTPVLRLYSKIYYATVCNVLGLALGAVTFWLAAQVLPAPRALYLCLAVYNVVVSLQIIPAWRVMGRPLSSAH